jgi:phage-related protein
MSYQIDYLIDLDGYLDKVSVAEQRKIARKLQYLQEYGVSPAIRDLKKMRGYDYWEVRILGKHNTRIFVYQKKSIVYILHIFRKTSRSTSRKDLVFGQKQLTKIT